MKQNRKNEWNKTEWMKESFFLVNKTFPPFLDKEVKPFLQLEVEWIEV